MTLYEAETKARGSAPSYILVDFTTPRIVSAERLQLSMATNNKGVQHKADAKRAGKRARAWTAIVYPESAPENWLDTLRDQLVECLVSPLHDKDMIQDGESFKPKKAHYHVVLSFKNPTTYAKACEVFAEIGAVVPPEHESRVKDFRQMARYLCHLDQPDKYRYDMQDVVSIGSLDYQTVCMSVSDENAILDEIFETMDTYYLDSYPKVVRFARAQKPEWKNLVYRKAVKPISEYAKGLHYELKTGTIAVYGAATKEQEKE